MDLLIYIVGLLAIFVILVASHEFGHLVMARAAGVQVLRFSIGFGRPVWKVVDKHGTEFVLAVIPLGGYIRMLDEREQTVPPEMRKYSFNAASPWWRIAIACGGPFANLILAFLVFFILFVGSPLPAALTLGSIEADSPAYRAGLRGGEEVVAIDGTEVDSWSQVAMQLTARIGDTGDVIVSTQSKNRGQEHVFEVEDWLSSEKEPDVIRSLGLVIGIKPVFGTVVADSAANEAGLLPGDAVTAVDGTPTTTWTDFVETIKESPEKPLRLSIRRASGESRSIVVVPRLRVNDFGQSEGFLGVSPALTRFGSSYGPFGAVERAWTETWQTTTVTLRILKSMVIGDVPATSVAGPITIARIAGESLQRSWEHFAQILALLSISLCIINLLPIPMLDGGHVLYALIQIATRRPVSERVEAIGTRIGLAFVACLLGLALFSDFSRLAG